jgi:hypothetical protein
MVVVALTWLAAAGASAANGFSAEADVELTPRAAPRNNRALSMAPHARRQRS